MQNIEFGVVTQKTIINVEEGYPLKTFAPVDENGEIANNGDAYGIVIDALGIGEVKQLVVMTAGCIDKICAEQHYGESYSAEAISALENIVIYDNHKIGGGGGGMLVVHFTVDTETEPYLATPDCEISEIYDAINSGMVVIAFCDDITGSMPLMWTNAGIVGFISTTYITDTHELATYKIYEEYDEDDNTYFVYAQDFVTLSVVDNS